MSENHDNEVTNSVAGAQIRRAALNALDVALESQRMQAQTEELIVTFLPLLDAVERVCRDLDRKPPEHVLRKSEAIALLAELADKALGQAGIERIGETGEPVDPSRHEIVDVISSPQSPPGAVVEVMRYGWRYQGRVVQQARVIITAQRLAKTDSEAIREN